MMVVKILLQDMSAWTLEPALMSATKKTREPSVNARQGKTPKDLSHSAENS